MSAEMIMLNDDLWDALFTLKILEKRMARSISKLKNEEKKIYRKIIDAILDNDKDTARDYARQLLRVRNKRREIEQYLSRIKLTRVDIEAALSAKELHDALLSTAKAITKLKGALNEIDFIRETEKAHQILETMGLLIKEEFSRPISLREEEKIDELLNKLETVAEEVIKGEIPEIADDTIKEEVEEIEEEQE